MAWSNSDPDSITLPTGATTGERVVINGSGITAYDSQGEVIFELKNGAVKTRGIGVLPGETRITLGSPGDPTEHLVSSRLNLGFRYGTSLSGFDIGTVGGLTDANGYVILPHNLGAAPIVVRAWGATTSGASAVWGCLTDQYTDETFRARCISATGAVLANVNAQLHYMAARQS